MDNLFSRFVVDQQACRRLMRKYGVIFSGSAVLWAFGSQSWEPSDLDLFVRRESLGSHGLVDWHEYLSSEGYRLQPRQPGAQVYCNSNVCIGTLCVQLLVNNLHRSISTPEGAAPVWSWLFFSLIP